MICRAKASPDDGPRGDAHADVFAVQKSTGGKLVYTVGEHTKAVDIKSLDDFAVDFFPSIPDTELSRI